MEKVVKSRHPSIYYYAFDGRRNAYNTDQLSPLKGYITEPLMIEEMHITRIRYLPWKGIRLT